MMKLFLSLTLVWAFSSTAGAVRCHVCTDFNDLDCAFGQTIECGQGEMCLNAFVRETNGTQRIYRNCATPTVCPVTGPQTIAANVNELYTVADAECCNVDDCNLKNLTFPDAPENNGIQCGSVNCKGEEDTCFQSEILKDRERITVAGCGTSNVCDIANDIRIVPFLEEVGTVLFTPTCYLFTTTTTPAPTTTTPEPTTTTPEPTTAMPESATDIPEPASTAIPNAPPTVDAESTTAQPVSLEVLAKIKALLLKTRLLSLQLKVQLVQQQQQMIFQLYLQLLDYHHQLVLQQEELPIYHHHQLPLYYQQCLLVNYHQLVLHQIRHSLCGQQNLLEPFHQQQLALYQLQELLNDHHQNILPHYYSYMAPDIGYGDDASFDE